MDENTRMTVVCCLMMFLVINCSTAIFADGVRSHLESIDSRPTMYFEQLMKVRMLAAKADYYEENKKDDSFHYQHQFQEILYVLKELLNGQNFNSLGEFDDTADGSRRKFSVLGALKEIVENGNISSSSCVNDTGRVILGLTARQFWAFQFLDAMGKPGPSITKGWMNFVGNYDQCRETTVPPSSNGSQGFTGNYCVLKVYNLVPNDPFPAQIGTCFPSTCSSSEITSLVKQIISRIGVPMKVQIEAECLEAKTKVTTATTIAILILCMVVSLALLGTFYDIIYIQKMFFSSVVNDRECLENGKRSPVNHEDEEALVDEASPLVPKVSVRNNAAHPVKCAMVKVILAFSVYTNGKKLLSTSQTSGMLSSIHGIRFLSMTWVVLGHVFAFGGAGAINSTTFTLTLLQRWTFDIISNAVFSVDTFFALSGLLTSYLTITHLKRKGLGINWPMLYFHRFWRLTPPYMFVLVIFLGLQQYLGEGPMWKNEQPSDKAACEKNWWTNLLYVNNLVHPREACFAHSWYLANDMQFFILSPLMLIPFYFHWALGVLSCTCFLLASWIATGVLSAQNHWNPSILGIVGTNWFDHYYIVPWCRIGPYVIGILSGYLLSMTKGRPFRMRWWMVVTGWVVAAASALAIIYGIAGDIDGQHKSSAGAAAFYNAVSRSAWGACVCWVVIACSAGYGGPINSLLSWSPFVVLGRLTYMVYLIHLNFIYIYVGNMGATFYANEISMTVDFLGLLVVTNLIAFVFCLFLESPMIGLEKVFLRNKRDE